MKFPGYPEISRKNWNIAFFLNFEIWQSKNSWNYFLHRWLKGSRWIWIFGSRFWYVSTDFVSICLSALHTVVRSCILISPYQLQKFTTYMNTTTIAFFPPSEPVSQPTIKYWKRFIIVLLGNSPFKYSLYNQYINMV